MCKLIVSYRTIAPFAFEEACAEDMHLQIKDHASLPFQPIVWIHEAPFGPLHTNAFRYQYINPYTMNLASFSTSTHITYITKFTSWMLLTTGHLLENIPYGMPQSLHFNFGQQISNLTFSAMPQNEFKQLSSAATQHNNYRTCQKKYYLVTL